MNENFKTRSSFQILIIDVIVFILLGFCLAFVDLFVLKQVNMSNSVVVPLGAIAFVVLIVGFAFYIFVEYKFNRLKFKNIFLYLGIAIAIGNFVAVMSLPSEMSLPNDAVLIISPLLRTYCILSGLFYGAIPYIYFYLIPKKVNSRHYLDIILYVFLGIVFISIIASFIMDWDKYIHFIDNPIGVESFYFHKNNFGMALNTGMFIAILLRIRHKNWKWILCLIPCYVVLLFTLSKTYMFMGTLMLIIYIIIQLVLVCKKSKDNLLITLLIIGFFVILSPLFIAGIIRSETGILAHVREFFTSLAENAKTTFESRQLIWESTFKLLSSWRVIFGYGINSFSPALHAVYMKDPLWPTWDTNVYWAHNFVLQLLGNGGILLLGIYLFLYIRLFYIAIKARNNYNYRYIDATLVFIVLFMMVGMFETSYIGGLLLEFMISIIVISLITGEHNLISDKQERKHKEELVRQAKQIQKVNFKSKLLNLNKKRLIYDAKYIACDLNSKIKL